MASNIQERKCPNCGSPLRFDPKSGNLLCEWCGSGFTIEQLDAAEATANVNEMNFTEANEALGNMNVYICKSCGAEIICDPTTVSLTCPYCGNNIVLTDKVTGSLVPDGVIPFKITPDKLGEAVRNFYKDKLLLPKNFLSDSSIGKVQGVYVPFWLYDTRPEGRVAVTAYTETSHREGDYIVTVHNDYRLDRDVSMRFVGVPVDASSKMEDDLMDSLEPYDYSEIRAFDTAYLAGYLSDRFDKDAQEVRDRADHRIMNSVAAAVGRRSTSPYINTGTNCSGVSLADSKARYILLPVYLFKVKYKNKDYSFAVNGQTGRVVGELPTDKGVQRAYWWKRFGIVAGILFAALWAFFIR